MDDVLVIGAGPAGLLAAWVARRTHARVRLLTTGIGTTHISPGWLSILDTDGDLQTALDEWVLGITPPIHMPWPAWRPCAAALTLCERYARRQA